tara:strand:+ start:96 stop:614 length:519 start_codon:yes stop_codon:yes gene_type:complete
MDLKIIDNFLTDNDFNLLVSNTIGRNDGQQVQFRVVSNVENFGAIEENWSWYMINMVYLMDAPQNEICGKIYQMFVPKFKELANFRTMIRIKINAYPYTNVVKEHKKHIDFNYENIGAVFSLNTCDGYTKFSDGTKVESVANRIVFFDASKYHQSTTTSNAKLRYNINFNFL